MFTRKVRNYAVITHFTHLQRNAAIVTRNSHTLVWWGWAPASDGQQGRGCTVGSNFIFGYLPYYSLLCGIYDGRGLGGHCESDRLAIVNLTDLP